MRPPKFVTEEGWDGLEDVLEHRIAFEAHFTRPHMASAALSACPRPRSDYLKMRHPEGPAFPVDVNEHAGSFTRSTTLTGYPALARSLGLDAGALMKSASIAQEALDDPCAMISVDSVAQLLETSAMQSGEQAFGLLLAENRRVSNLGMLGLIIREEVTVRCALDCLVKYAHLQNRALDFWLEDLGEFSMLHFSLRLQHNRFSHQGIEMAAGVTVLTLQAVSNGAFVPASVSFVHGRPSQLDVHKRVLGPKIDFAQAFNAVAFRNQVLDLPIPGADPAITSSLKKELDLQLAQTDQEVAESVRRAVRILLAKGNCSVDLVADYLGMHRRTLSRRLAANKQSVSSIVDDVRGQMAQTFLRGGQRTHYQIANLLNFSSGAEFSRWFRTRFGMTASQWSASGETSQSPASWARTGSRRQRG